MPENGGEEIIISKSDKLEDVAQLASTERYKSTMAQVAAALASEEPGVTVPSINPSEDDPTYRYVNIYHIFSITCITILY